MNIFFIGRTILIIINLIFLVVHRDKLHGIIIRMITCWLIVTLEVSNPKSDISVIFLFNIIGILNLIALSTAED